jgi:hypothetical protein
VDDIRERVRAPTYVCSISSLLARMTSLGRSQEICLAGSDMRRAFHAALFPLRSRSVTFDTSTVGTYLLTCFTSKTSIALVNNARGRGMSFHYTLSVVTRIREQITPEERQTLEYFINGRGALPEKLPPQPCFSGDTRSIQYSRYHGDLSVSRFEHDLLTLFAIGHKLEGVYEEVLQFCTWIATLVRNDGYIGCVVCEDGAERLPMQFHSFGGRLHISTPKSGSIKVFSVVGNDDATREVSC